MWTVVYIAPNKKEAEKIRDLFLGEGLLVKLNEITTSEDDPAYEVLVPESEIDEALELLGVV